MKAFVVNASHGETHLAPEIYERRGKLRFSPLFGLIKCTFTRYGTIHAGGIDMKIISWNLNGLLSCVKHRSFAPIEQILPDYICLQEIRTQQEPEIIPGYIHHWNHSQRDGYSGTATLSINPPRNVKCGFDDGFPDTEGRLLTIELDGFYIVNAYVPNSQKNLKRHYYRMEWDTALRRFVCDLQEDKPVILCGDFNVARMDIDVYEENLRQYWAEQGYASDERSNLETLLEMGFTDVYRHFYPQERSYTWWSNRLKKRGENRGWRLDYFIVSNELLPRISNIQHLSDITGSDHCPIMIEVK